MKLTEEERLARLATLTPPKGGWGSLDDANDIRWAFQARWHTYWENGVLQWQDVVTGKTMTIGECREESTYSTCEIPSAPPLRARAAFQHGQVREMISRAAQHAVRPRGAR